MSFCSFSTTNTVKSGDGNMSVSRKFFGSLNSDTFSLPSNKSSSSNSISATEFAALKAEIWTLKNSLIDAEMIMRNMQDVITNTVREKYELIEELNESKLMNQKLKDQLEIERNLHVKERKEFLSEISDLKKNLRDSVKINEINLDEQQELKKIIQDANETIYKMGIMYLNMKTTKNELIETFLR